MARASQLREAMDGQRLVRFRRRFENGSVHGYVLEVGPRFFLLLVVADGVRFNGFQCLRICDVCGLKPDPHAGFVEAVLKKRGERRPKSRGIVVASLSDLLQSANRRFPLLTIHIEKLDPDVCYIGRVLGIERGRVGLLNIDPGAIWRPTPSEYRLSDITRVDFGGDYEGALHMIGREPPGGKRSYRGKSRESVRTERRIPRPVV